MKITGSINEYLSVIKSSREFSLDFSPELIHNQQFYPALYTTVEYWDTARNWLVKLEWDSKLKVHPRKIVRNALKPRGLLLVQYFKLCERCHAYQDGSVIIPFHDAGQWFSKIFVELIGIDLAGIINPPSDPYKNNNRKQARIGVERERLRLLKSGENPFKQDQQALGLTLLIEVALRLSDQSDNFVKTHWKPFLKAYSAHITEMTAPHWGTGFVEREKYFIQAGKGKGGTGRQLQGKLEDVQKAVFGTFTP
jgi:hypothetical protein